MYLCVGFLESLETTKEVKAQAAFFYLGQVEVC